MTNEDLSSIEWLFMMLTPAKPNEQLKKIIEKAKELHKQEIINAVDGFPLSKRGLDGDEYYEQLFNQSNK